MASVSAVGAVIAYARGGDGDTVAAVMDREAEISLKEGNGEERGEEGQGRMR